MEDVKVTVFDGAYHDVDSSEMAFKICGSICVKEACRRAKPVLLEPMMAVEVVVPEEYMGPVNGDMVSRRGQLEGTEIRGTTQIIKASVPLSEMFGYATELRSRTQGRGSFTMHFARYEEVPKNIAEEIVTRVQGKVTKLVTDYSKEIGGKWRKKNLTAASRTSISGRSGISITARRR